MSSSPRAPDRPDGTADLRPMWAFPRRRPQLHGASPAALAVATRYYAFGRPLTRWQRRLVEGLVAVPGARRLVADRVRFAPPCGWSRWPRLVASAGIEPAVDWVFFVPAWRYDRFGAFPVAGGRVASFLQVRRAGLPDLHPDCAGEVRVPAVLRTADADGWAVRVMEPLPPRLRAPRLDAARLRTVIAAVEDCLAGMLPEPDGRPAGWRPMHGDLTPWNLRESPTGELWLLDWEAAAWGPPGADALHYRLAEASLVVADAAELAQRAAAALGGVDPETARFWLGHEAFAGPAPDPGGSRGRRSDVARREAVIAALRLLAA